MRDALRGLGRVVVAYSGGIDSTYLCAVALEELGEENVVAVTAVSETYPPRELEEAKSLARALGFSHRLLETAELADERFRSNPPERCYYCKSELFGKLRSLAEAEGYGRVVDGTNADDVGDYRPGRKAAAELGVRSPLLEAGLGKREIRELARLRAIPIWDKAAAACLASRFPFGRTLSVEGLRRVDRAEEILRKLGLRQVRVRDHGDVARIEVGAEELDRLVSPEARAAAVRGLKELGYRYVALDLEGYRTGSLNPFESETGAEGDSLYGS